MQPHNVYRLVLQLTLAVTVLAQCNQDNCYRAFAQKTSSVSSFCSTYTTTINTATTSLPTYATACSNLPSEISSACSCIAPSTPPHPACTPTPIVNLNVRNGGFNTPSIAPYYTTSTQPPWAVQSSFSKAGSVFFKNDGTSSSFHGGGYASFNFDGQAYGTGSQPASEATARLIQPITFCELAYYNISFALRQTYTESQSCGVEIGWSDSNYGLAGYGLNAAWTEYGPTRFESTYVGGPPADNPDGTFNSVLTVDVFCVGIRGVTPPAVVQVGVDSLVIVPS